MDISQEDSSFLADLEERIVKAVEVVTALRKENASLEEKLSTATSGQADSEKALAAAQQENARLQKEVDSLAAERKQVRARIEKLLGQMDMLSAG
ncbi:MAG: cell division protein ZapB [Acidobacteria bacterium]|nr:cell division protein ZapB [Acidobacteriota bacterium]